MLGLFVTVISKALDPVIFVPMIVVAIATKRWAYILTAAVAVAIAGEFALVSTQFWRGMSSMVLSMPAGFVAALAWGATARAAVRWWRRRRRPGSAR
jgi:hypothetical protein